MPRIIHHSYTGTHGIIPGFGKEARIISVSKEPTLPALKEDGTPSISPEEAQLANKLAFKQLRSRPENREVIQRSTDTFYFVFECGEPIRQQKEELDIDLRFPAHTTIFVLDCSNAQSYEVLGVDYQQKRTVADQQDAGVIYRHYPKYRRKLHNDKLGSGIDDTVLMILQAIRRDRDLQRLVRNPHAFDPVPEGTLEQSIRNSYESSQRLRRKIEDLFKNPDILKNPGPLPADIAVREVVQDILFKIRGQMVIPLGADYYFDPLHFLRTMVTYFVDEMRSNVLYLIDRTDAKKMSDVRIISAHDWRANGLSVTNDTSVFRDPDEPEYRLHTDPALVYALKHPNELEIDFPQKGAGIDRLLNIRFRDAERKLNQWILAFDDRQLPREFDELDKELQRLFRDMLMFQVPFINTRKIVLDFFNTKTRH